MPVVEDVPMPDVSVEQEEIPRARSVSIAPSRRSRMSTPALEHETLPFDETEPTYADSTCPIAQFDERGAASQATPEVESQHDDKGYSRNTIKALGLIRGELQVEEGGTEKVMSFNEMANKVSFVPTIREPPGYQPTSLGIEARCVCFLLRATALEHQGLHQGHPRSTIRKY